VKTRTALLGLLSMASLLYRGSDMAASAEEAEPKPKVRYQEVKADFTKGKIAGLLPTSAGLALRNGAMHGTFESEPFEAPFPFVSFGARWKAIYPLELSIRVRGSRDGLNWSDWQTISIDDDLADANKSGTSIGSLIYLGPSTRFIEYALEIRESSVRPSRPLSDLTFAFIDPGETPTEALKDIARKTEASSSAVSLPPVVSRVAWGCPDGESSPQWSPQYTTVSHLIVHHTVNQNGTVDWPALVRSIWADHTYNRQWGDIGYNYLIDPNGTVYEGRAGGDNVVGAHFSCRNANTMGVGMLGTFSAVSPTAAALNSLENLLAWKAGQRSLDPLGISYHPGTALNLFTISGHRDSNASPYVPYLCPGEYSSGTNCPGDSLYSLLPSIRTAVHDRLGGGNANVSVSLAANPTSGTVPVNGVSLTASVTGSTQQTINYTFYCDRTDTGVNITFPYDAKFDGTFTNPLTVSGLCDYPTVGTHTAKVIAEQGLGAAQSQAQVKVSQVPQTCNSLVLARNDSAGGGLPTASPAKSVGCTSGQYTAGQLIQLTAYPAIGWSVGGWNGTQNDTSTSTMNTMVMPASSTYVSVIYAYTPPTGAVRVDGSLDGVPWSGPVSFSLQGPSPYNGNWVTTLGNGLIVGYYALFYYGGGPSGASLTSITPSSYQYLAPGSGIAFSFNFTTPPGYPVNVVTGPADSITQTSAVLHGSANPNGAATSGLFVLFGPYPYPRFTSNSVSLGSTKTDQQFAVEVSGLTCGTRYEYLADAINAFGESNGGAPSFETAACGTHLAADFYTLTPCRVLDTRDPNDPNHPAIQAGEVRVPVFAGRCGIPSTATAVSVNVTVVNPSTTGSLSLSPVVSTSTSTISFGPGQVRANNAVIGLNEAGGLAVFCGMPFGAVDYIVDVNGYFQ
jgi:N-acetylmuramoyl-L-alanine amidase-like protein/List-Bact-rpt repeat protein